jgi:hypothetical protein
MEEPRHLQSAHHNRDHFTCNWSVELNDVAHSIVDNTADPIKTRRLISWLYLQRFVFVSHTWCGFYGLPWLQYSQGGRGFASSSYVF